ncbi:hypothetical protein L1987_43057 [Smallanthus sonchifolius]|uniref:Uncharacterized protein n=1 Tax=Smallanthus sonchifolius TaxID=185202 RepID=A0ACB9GL96_9ASTR|nr:hypothetical protein L1987_43057 [Smallanthus sonchifolius]
MAKWRLRVKDRLGHHMVWKWLFIKDQLMWKLPCEPENVKSNASDSEDVPKLNKLYEDIDQFVDDLTFNVDEFDEIVKKIE